MNTSEPTSTQRGAPPVPRARVVRSAMLDLAIVVAFVAIGRRNHDEDFSIGGFVGTLAPFVIGLIASWLAGRIWRDPVGTTSGVVVWIGTVAVGMVLRRFAFDDGTATAFVIVATVFIGTLTNGWRTWARFRASS